MKRIIMLEDILFPNSEQYVNAKWNVLDKCEKLNKSAIYWTKWIIK